MKHMKKLIVAALAVVTTVALCVPALAFANTITITRDATYNGDSGGRTYTAYKVFDSDVSLKTNDGGAAGTNTQNAKDPTYNPDGPISYTMATNSPWKAAMLDDTNQIWFDVKMAADNSKYVVTLKDGVDNTAATAKAFAAYLNGKLPIQGLTGTTITPGTPTEVGNGYFLVVASDGATNLTLVTTDVKIVEKNTYLKSGKTSPKTSHYVGEKIPYTATVDIPADANPNKPIIVHDKMTPATALDFNNDVTAKVGTTDIPSTAYDVNTNPSDECKFEITIPASLVSDNLGKTITFKYTATVTSAAATATGLVNELFAEESGYKTTPVQTIDYTFDFDFLKTFAGTNEAKTAKFELRTTAADASTALKFTKSGNIYTKSDSTAASAEVTVTNQTKVTFHGLKAGTYYLVETATSDGFNLLTAPLPVVIEDTTTDPATAITYTVNDKAPTVAVTIENQKGTVLPSTGGIGTTIFYIIGAILVIGAGVVLITKRRVAKRNKNDEL